MAMAFIKKRVAYIAQTLRLGSTTAMIKLVNIKVKQLLGRHGHGQIAVSSQWLYPRFRLNGNYKSRIITTIMVPHLTQAPIISIASVHQSRSIQSNLCHRLVLPQSRF